jgi:hypothetical protein
MVRACAQGPDLARPVEIWGEDALLQWPRARQTVIAERDAYMARTIWAAATGAHLPPLLLMRRWTGIAAMYVTFCDLIYRSVTQPPNASVSFTG